MVHQAEAYGLPFPLIAAGEMNIGSAWCYLEVTRHAFLAGDFRMRTWLSPNRHHNVCWDGHARVAVFGLCVLALLSPLVSSAETPASIQATYMEQVAAQLDAGAFEVLDTEGFSGLLRGHRPDGSGAPAIDTWTDSGQWDPKRQQTFFMGLRQSNRFLSYHARGNAWEEIQLDREHAPPLFESFGHMYGRTALDWQRGHHYRLAGSTLHRYVIDEDRWERFENSPIGGYISIDWHYGLDMLVGLAGHELHGFRDGQWFPLGQAGVHGYHSSAQYNPLRKDMMFIGGNQSRQNVDILTADGTLHRMADAPFGFGISQDNLTYDPLSGNYLVLHRDRKLWEYNPDLDEWKVARDFNEPSSAWPFGKYWAVVPIPIDELGVIFWQNSRGPHLYRHEAVLPSHSEVEAAERWVQDPPSAASPGGAGVSPAPERAGTPETESSSEVGQQSAPASAASTGPEVGSEIGPAPRAADLTGSVIRALRENADGPDSAPEDAVSGGFSHSGGSALSPGDVRALRAGEKSLDDLEPVGPSPAAVALANGGSPGGGGKQGESRAGPSIDPALIPRANPVQRPSPPRALSAIGATMRPGEWRYISERAARDLTTYPEGYSHLKNLLYVPFCGDGSGGTMGNGWTDEWVYDPETKSFWFLAMRDKSEKRLVWLDKDLRWGVHKMPWGEDCSSNRRPFDRLNLVDGYLYWPPAWWGDNRRKNGVMHRAPIAPYLAGEFPEWEMEAQPIGWDKTSSGQIGDFSMRWWPAFGGWIMGQPGTSLSAKNATTLAGMQEGHTAEGLAQGKKTGARLFYLRPGIDTEWVFFDRLYTQGYRLRVVANPLKPNELLVTPGGFTDNTDEWTRIELKENGLPIARKLDKANRPELANTSQFSIANDILTYHPLTGDYLWLAMNGEKMLRSTDGKNWSFYEEFTGMADRPDLFEGKDKFAGGGGLFGASPSRQAAPIPGTDLILWFDYYAGLILHRCKPASVDVDPIP